MNKHSLLTNQVTSYLNRVGGFSWKNNTGACKVGNRFIRYGFKGSPDILGIFNSVPIGVEVKTGTGRQSKDQKEFEKKFVRSGGMYIVARSMKDVEKMIATIQEYTEQKIS